MRILALATVSALALGAAACAPRVDYAARTRLDCPDRKGELVRASVAADGKSCLYRAGDVDVTLQLTPVSGGDPYAALKTVETSLMGPGETPAKGDEAAAAKGDEVAVAKASGASHDAAAKAAEDAAKDAGQGGDWNSDNASAHVRKDGKDIDVSGADDDGDDHAHVNLPGVHIDADNGGARVDVAGIHIDASGDTAIVRYAREVRLRGHGFSPTKDGLRASFFAHRDTAPDGYRVVGYEASGPKSGPLTVALVRSHDDIEQGGRLHRDIERLVRENGGA